MTLTCGSLFSGIGGLDNGLARAGFRHAFFCESDPWRRSVLAAHWPGVPVYDDVRAVGAADLRLADRRGDRQDVGREQPHLDRGPARPDASSTLGGDIGGLGSPDLLCGGFPCQDVSVAGQRRGLAGARSGLFHEFARIAESLRPRWLLVENVPGLLSSNGGRDFGVVLATLADIGYGVAWRVVDSRFFGVPQRRRRVFIVGALAVGDPRAAAERAGEILAVGTSCGRHPPTGREAGPEVAGTLGGGAGERGWAQDTERMTFVASTVRSHPRPGSNSDGNLVSLALNAKRGKRDDGESETFVTSITMASDPISAHELAQPSTKRNGDPGVVQFGATVRRLTPTECERLQSLPDGWTNPDGKAPDSRRYAGLGDAVTASVGEWIGRRIIECA